MPPVINKTKCTVCGLCAEICCMDVLKKTEEEHPKIICTVSERMLALPRMCHRLS